MENYGGKTIIHTSWCQSHLFSISMDTSVYYCFHPKPDSGIGIGMGSVDYQLSSKSSCSQTSHEMSVIAISMMAMESVSQELPSSAQFGESERRNKTKENCLHSLKRALGRFIHELYPRKQPRQGIYRSEIVERSKGRVKVKALESIYKLGKATALALSVSSSYFSEESLNAIGGCRVLDRLHKVGIFGILAHRTVPWPRYSRKLTFGHSRPHPFLYQLEFLTVGLNPGPVRGSRFVAKTL